MDENELLKVIEPQLLAHGVIARALVARYRLLENDAQDTAVELIARLAQHEPPILLVYPEQVREPSEPGWVVLTGNGYPARCDDDEFEVAHFSTEDAAQQWIVEHPKAKSAYAVALRPASSKEG